MITAVLDRIGELYFRPGDLVKESLKMGVFTRYLKDNIPLETRAVSASNIARLTLFYSLFISVI